MKKNKLVTGFLAILFLGFCGLYFTYGTGYYEYSQYKKQVLTQKQINQFEKDVKEGKKINTKKYLNIEVVKTNKIANIGNYLTTVIGNVMRESTLTVFESMSDYVSKS